MLIRFASAAAVASVLIALAALGLQTLDVPDPDGVRLLQTIWCVLPLLWGVWAVLIPPAWAPNRIPLWGAMFGLAAALVVLFGMDLLEAMGFDTVPYSLKLVFVPIIALAYGAFWTAVKAVYERLESAGRLAGA